MSIWIEESAPNGYALKCFRVGDDQAEHRHFVNAEAKLGPDRRTDAERSALRKDAGQSESRSPAPKLSDVPVPEMTPPEPGERATKFQAVGRREPPPVAGELKGRRHAYIRDGAPVRFKIKKTVGSPWIDFYRVLDSKTGRTGWQARRPAGFVPCPYVASANPFDPVFSGETVFWPEGEKDVDTLARFDLPAFTFGGATDVPEGCGELLAGRDVVILPDNDGGGRIGTRTKITELAGHASRVRVVDFSDLEEGKDVTDWMEAGGTVEALWQRVDAATEVPVAAPTREDSFEPTEARAPDQPVLDQPAPDEPPRIPTLDEFRAVGFVFDGDTPLEPPRYIVKPLLPAKGVGILGGQSGAAKTFSAIELANCLAEGRDFFGHRVVERVGTLIIAAEGAGTLANRLDAVRKAKGGSKNQPIVRREKVPNLSDPAQVLELQRWIRGIDAWMRRKFGVRLGLIVIDTLIAAFGLQDENNSAEAQRVITHMQMLGEPIDAFVLAVHHYGKDEHTGLRGSSAYRAGADVVLSLLAERNQATGEVKGRSLNKAKLRDGEEGRIAGFNLRFVELGTDNDDEPFGACVVEPDLDASAVAPPPRKEALPIRAFREAFHEVMIQSGREVEVRGSGPRVRAITLEELRPEFRRRYTTVDTDETKADAAIRQGLKRAIDACPKQGFETATWGGEKWFWRVDA
ncbi:AAA family ATPase [Methylobacterium sp. E-066]|uniref:AAA family ATPase n=1 Tax=Methylobacterium sp. E-066 TaxID=2836584 RepID=UPI001FB87591|nr:AAA family ATPase [Methylobacterium sp. E-066]MCJ2139418.1 AAA family ATPase [Methylobacterium sp. E-066]